MLRILKAPSYYTTVKTAAMATASNTSIVEPHLLRQINTHQLRAYSQQAAGPSFHLRILDSIKEDHREITACGEHILQSSDPDEQTRCQNQFTWELARHAVAEELVLFPAMEKYLEGGRGKEMAEKERGEHQKVPTLPFFFFFVYNAFNYKHQEANDDR